MFKKQFHSYIHRKNSKLSKTNKPYYVNNLTGELTQTPILWNIYEVLYIKYPKHCLKNKIKYITGWRKEVK